MADRDRTAVTPTRWEDLPFEQKYPAHTRAVEAYQRRVNPSGLTDVEHFAQKHGLVKAGPL